MLGTCVLEAPFPRGRKQLQLSALQGLVMLLFNDSPEWSVAEIAAHLGAESSETRRTVQSLACGKVRVLTKRPDSREMRDDDVVAINWEFSHSMMRIKIPLAPGKESVAADAALVDERVARDRLFAIDAAIVRTMKSRKALKHSLLIAELFGQLRVRPIVFVCFGVVPTCCWWFFLQFPVKPIDLKKRIDSLIDREYLQRDAVDSQVYTYLAWGYIVNICTYE
jgi:cullin-4